jgi:hypothetical protein
MKPQLTESEKFELEMIDREIRQADIECRVAAWVVIPVVFSFFAWFIVSLIP